MRCKKMKKNKFVLVNHSILDFEEFKKDFCELAASFKPEIFEVAGKYGFKLIKIGSRSELNNLAVFYNEQLDMQLVVVVKKKSPPEFV